MDIAGIFIEYDIKSDSIKKAVIEKVMKLYTKYENDCTFIAHERNKILTHVHGKLPYTMWDEASVGEETPAERAAWFRYYMPKIINMYEQKHFSPISEKFVGPTCEDG